MSHLPRRKPVVRVLLAGAALSMSTAGCTKEPPTTNPPVPETPPEAPPGPPGATGELPPPTMNPPPPDPSSLLPAWDDVESGHPAGATNPPMPVLVVNEAGDTCYKAWYDPRVVPVEARQKGGVVLDEGEEPTGTQVQCPADQVAEVLAHHAEIQGQEGTAPGEAGGE